MWAAGHSLPLDGEFGEAGGVLYAQTFVHENRIRQAASGVGAAQYCVSESVKYAKQRVVFGKPLRITNCDCERQMEPSLLQALYVRNDKDLVTLLDTFDGRLHGSGLRLQVTESDRVATRDAIPAEWMSDAPGQVRSWTQRNMPNFCAAAAISIPAVSAGRRFGTRDASMRFEAKEAGTYRVLSAGDPGPAGVGDHR